MTNPNKQFWDDHGRVGLVWSNPNASDDVLITAALLRPNFHLPSTSPFTSDSTG